MLSHFTDWGAESRIPMYNWDTLAMVERIQTLRQPYQGNAVQWLQAYMRRPIDNLEPDLEKFLGGLSPFVRERFVDHVIIVLDDAVRFFGTEVIT
jgi:hypothetical protein